MYLAAGLASITGFAHLWLGLSGVFDWIATGESSVLAPLFVAAGIAIFGGMATAYYRPTAVRPIYVSGIVLSTLMLVGYVDWHGTGYAESALGLEEGGHDHGGGDGGHHDQGDGNHDHDDHDHGNHDDEGGHDHNGHDHGDAGHDNGGHDHGDDTVGTLVDHLVADSVALASKAAEVVLIPLLGLLYVRSD